MLPKPDEDTHRLRRPLEIGDRVRYRARRYDGTWREGEGVVLVIWEYDEHPVVTLTDGVRLLTQFGDTWEKL